MHKLTDWGCRGDSILEADGEKGLQALPCSASASSWGKEIYFEMPVTAKLEPAARQVVDKGVVCFWVAGRLLALPYGPTPISQGDECRLVSEVNVLGRIDGDARGLNLLKQ